jgi:peroxiredoxin
MNARRLAPILVGLLLAAAIVVGYRFLRAPEASLVKVGDHAPELELAPLDMRLKTSLSGYLKQGPVLLVMFFSDCSICQQELPEIELIHRRYVPRNLMVLGVGVDRDASKLRAFLDVNEVSFTVLHDPDGQVLRRTWGSYKFPEAYLIDSQGIVRQVWLGRVNWRRPEVREAIRAVLAPEPGASPPGPVE